MSEQTVVKSAQSDSLPLESSRQRLATIVQRTRDRAEMPDQDYTLLLSEGIALARQLDDAQALGRLLMAHAEILFRRAEYVQAEELIGQILTMVDPAENGSLAANAHSILAAIRMETGRYHDAEAHTRHALKLARETGNRVLEAIVLAEVAALSYLLGDFDDAIAQYLEAMSAEEELGDKRRTAMILGNLGLIFNESGDHQEALHYFDAALTIFRELGHRHGEAVNLLNSGIAWEKLGEYERALEYCRQALEIAASIGSRSVESSSFVAVGNIYLQLGDSGQAYECYLKGLAIHEEIGDKLGSADALLHLGRLFTKLGDIDQALSRLHAALAISEEIGARAQLYQVHAALSETYEQGGAPTQALAHYKLFYQIRSETATDHANTRLKHLQARIALEKLEKEAEITRLKAVRMEHELQIAQTVQMSLLPRQAPTVAGLQIASFCLPALEAGGDYFDYFPLGDRRIGAVIGDVTGKGMGAAIYMTLVKGMLTSLVARKEGTGRMLVDLNDHVRATFSRSSFISMIYMTVDLDAMEMTYTCAGHSPILLLRNGELVRRKSRGGMALGLAPSAQFATSLDETTIPLEVGDTILLYTDGFSEALNREGDEFGDDALLQAARRHADAPTAQDLLDAIRNEVDAFTTDAGQHDDMTMIVMRIGEKNVAGA